LRLINHNNNIILLSGLPGNYKKFVSAKINKYIFKKCRYDDFINGSTAKKRALSYRGCEAGSSLLNLNKNEALVFDGEHYNKIIIPYMEDYDSKAHNVPIIVHKHVEGDKK
jgi:hypothetical protein